MKFQLFSTLCLAAVGAASAHLGALTAPKGGETFKAGDEVNITWSVDTPHNGIDLAVSTDGSTWKTFTTASLGRTVKTFKWVVPNTPSTTARIRICQRDGSGVQGCTDAHNSNHAQDGVAVPGGEVYTLISPNFTISGGTPVIDLRAPAPALIRPNLDYRTLDLSFELEKNERVLLRAYDMQGKLLATLLDEIRPAGEQSFSVFSNSLDAGRAMVFKLHVGDRLITQAWNGAR